MQDPEYTDDWKPSSRLVRLIRRLSKRRMFPLSPFRRSWVHISWLVPLITVIVSAVMVIANWSWIALGLAFTVSLASYALVNTLIPWLAKFMSRVTAKRTARELGRRSWIVHNTIKSGTTLYETFVIPAITMNYAGSPVVYPVYSYDDEVSDTEKRVNAVEASLRTKYQEPPELVKRTEPDRSRPYTVLLYKTVSGSGVMNDDSAVETVRDSIRDYESKILKASPTVSDDAAESLSFRRIRRAETTVPVDPSVMLTGDANDDAEMASGIAERIRALAVTVFSNGSSIIEFADTVDADAKSSAALVASLQASRHAVDADVVKSAIASTEAHIGDLVIAANTVLDALDELSKTSADDSIKVAAKQLQESIRMISDQNANAEF